MLTFDLSNWRSKKKKKKKKKETTIDEVIIQRCPFLGAIPKIKRQSFLETTFGFLGSKFASESV